MSVEGMSAPPVEKSDEIEDDAHSSMHVEMGDMTAPQQPRQIVEFDLDGTKTDVRSMDVGQAATPQHPAAQTPSRGRISVPVRDNHKLEQIIERVNADIELFTIWRCANINAVDRLGISDHGRVHVQIVANIGLKILRLLIAGEVVPSVVKNYGLSNHEAEVIVVLGALTHDLGISIHRDEHEHFSLIIAQSKIKELLDGIYDIETATILRSEILHSVLAHHKDIRTFSVEAGIVKVADALDMAKGRSRIPFEAGHVNIHSVSAAAIESVELSAGEAKPVHVQINMSNSAGIFQIDDLLKKKLSTSGLKPYIELVASIAGETEARLIPIVRL